MSNTGIDASFQAEVFRVDWKEVIAMKRELAVIGPVRLAPKVASGDYVAGQVLARYTAGAQVGLFVDYADGGSNGRQTAAAILLTSRDSIAATEAASANMGLALFKGIVYESALIGLDAAAKVDLAARSWVDARGVTFMEF